MKLRFTPHALRDLRELANYVRAENPAAARRVRSAIYETLRDLILFPKVGRRQSTEGVRKVVTRKYPYLVYYTLDEVENEIIILNVKHPARERNYSDI